ncbi:putative U box domain, armadillo-like helical, Zinc finger, RING/FYVE/PHD-type [Dioscorea sansibarensis]
MGKDCAKAQVLPNSSCVKAHTSICHELMKVLDRIYCVLPEIELARPGCQSGIQELCSLNNAVEKAMLLLRHCTESSKLYLAITGETILLRCERIRNSMNHSLTQIQNMVPEQLAAQIGEILSYLRGVKFSIDSTEEEAAKIILELLRQTETSAESELQAFQVATSKLDIVSSKALLLERRSIMKLLEKFRGTDPKKEGILKFLLYLLKKYGKKVISNFTEGKILNSKCTVSGSLISGTKPHNRSSCFDTTPEEFLCPISSKIMFDPVTIASGKTYERLWIERWFNEGNDTCPKTQKKLPNLSMVPNSHVKDRIADWCRKLGISVQDPGYQANPTKFLTFDSSHFDSVSSLMNVPTLLLEGTMGNYILQSDQSNVSFISSHIDCCTDSSHIKDIGISNGDLFNKLLLVGNYQISQRSLNFNRDAYLKFFNSLSELPIELQRKAVEDVKVLLDVKKETRNAMLSNGFAEALMCFIKNANGLSNVQAQKAGAQILLALLDKWRYEVPSLCEDAFQLSMMFLDSELVMEALMIMRILTSCRPNYLFNIVASGAVPLLIRLLDTEDTDILELALNIITDISAQSELRSQVLSPECISKLVPQTSCRKLAEKCMRILRNLSETEKGALMIAETNGCIASIAELLDNGNHNEQEHAVVILHSLCLHSFDHLLHVKCEDVIPSLCVISQNGTSKAKESSMALLIVLRDLSNSKCTDGMNSQATSTSNGTESVANHHYAKGRAPSSKHASGSFTRRFRFFLKKMNLCFR